MASKPETVFYTAVNRLLPRVLHKEKMCNPYRGGTADFWYSGNAGDLWIEYKWLQRAPHKQFDLTAGKNPVLSGLQQKWLRERHGEGRSVAVMIGTPSGVMVLQNVEWATPVTPAFILTRLDAAIWIQKRTYDAKKDCTVGNSSKSHDPDV